MREPIAFPAIARLACGELTTDDARAAVHVEVCAAYCQRVEAVLRGGRFTECGGLWLKKAVRAMEEELVRVLGDEVFGRLELRRLQVFAVLVSLPADVLDASSVAGVCQSAQVELSEEEVQSILSLRVADVQWRVCCNKHGKSTLNRAISALLHDRQAHRLGGVDNLRDDALQRNILQVGVLLLHLGNLVDLLQRHLAHVHVSGF